MEEDTEKQMWRSAELQRRYARQKELKRQLRVLHALMRNEGMLLEEVLTPDERKIHAKALRQIELQQLTINRIIHPNYWRRLFNALLPW